MKKFLSVMFLGPFYPPNKISFGQWIGIWALMAITLMIGTIIGKGMLCLNHAMDNYLSTK